MKEILTVLLVLVISSASAQSNNTQSQSTDSLWYKRPFFRYYPVIMNKETRLLKGEAAALFEKVPEAYDDYKKYKRRSKISLYSYAGLFVGTAVSVLGFQNNNKGLGATGLTVSVYAFINSIVFGAMADGNLRKAIKAYNQAAVRY